MSGLLGNLPNLGNYAPRGGQGAWSLNSIFLYLLAGFFVVLVWLLLSGTKIDWSMFDPRPKSWQVAGEGYKYWTASAQDLVLDPASPTAAFHPPAVFDGKNYAISFEFVLYNTRGAANNTSQRHLLNRGGDPRSATALPAMNPGVFLDPVKNDVLVYIQTESGSQPLLDSIRIEDIPMDIPQRMTIVVRNRVMEVYLNCRLEATRVLSGRPSDVENKWYGRAGTSAANAGLQNLYIWTRDLSSNEVRTLCDGSPISPFSLSSCGAVSLGNL